MSEFNDEGLHLQAISRWEGVALVIVLLGFTYVGGLLGGALGIALVATRLLFAPITVYALAHVIGLVLLGTSTLSDIVILEASLVPFLLVAGSTREISDGFAPAMVIAIIGFAILSAVGLLTFDPLWMTTALGLAVAGVIAYGLHRYELVRLGLVSDSS